MSQNDRFINLHLNNIRQLINVVNDSQTLIYQNQRIHQQQQQQQQQTFMNYPSINRTNQPQTNTINTNANINTTSINSTNIDNIPQTPEPTNQNSSINNINQSLENIFTNYLLGSLGNNITNLNTNASDNNDQYVIRFDTFIPSNNNNSNRDLSYNITDINYDNSYILVENNNDDISNSHLYNVSEFRLIDSPINNICPITRERFYDNQNGLMIRNCRHIFNKSSLMMWINNHNSCPSCRASIL